MLTSRKPAACVITMLSLASPTLASASPRMVGVGPGGFYNIDESTGVCTLVGPLDPDTNLFQQPAAMAIRPSDGKIFLWNNVDYGVLNYSLSTIDPDTGRATVLRRYYGAVPMQALAFSPGGMLYGGASTFYRFDSAWALTSLSTFGQRIDGFDFGPDGRLYGLDGTWNRLVTIDPASGTITSSVNLSVSVGYPGSLVFSPGGGLLGVGSWGASGGRLFDVDPVTGAVANQRYLTARIFGVSFIPEPCALTLWLCAALMLQRHRPGRRTAGRQVLQFDGPAESATCSWRRRLYQP